VQAQNRLGYIALAQGRFEQAEDLFETYRFIAPDQANPHDSMGELLTLIGRYEDAEAALRKALEVRSDFCASYDHLIRLYLLQGRFADARATLAEAGQEEACARMGNRKDRFQCSIGLWERTDARDWEGAWTLAQECKSLEGDAIVLAHAAAVRTGHDQEAGELEQQFLTRLQGEQPEGKEPPAELLALVAHLEGVRAVGEGDLREATARFLEADRKLAYWDGDGMGIFKLYNQANLAEILERLGESKEAREVVGRIRAVNPPFAAEVSAALQNPRGPGPGTVAP
jgi:tetratricopeptide (TPR) repeat protein